MIVSLLVSAFIVIFDNRSFWKNLALRLSLTTPEHWALAVSAGIILVLFLNVIFLAVGARPLFKPILVTVLLVAAGVSYFSDSFGVVIDKSMIHNVFETDVSEASELITWRWFSHMALYGLLPAVLIITLPLRYSVNWWKGLLFRFSGIAISLVLVLALALLNFKGLVLFGRENRDLQRFINPAYPAYSLSKVLRAKSSAHSKEPLKVVGNDAKRTANTPPSIVVLILGETARASEFALNGYLRDTNPYTGKLDIVNFTDVESCGTATAESVPCMFSDFGKEHFSKNKASGSENLLDVLQRTGIKVVWRDNDSGSKGVADRVVFEDFSKKEDAQACSGDNCFDEVLLGGLEESIKDSKEDTLIVLHLKGSHGPSYYKRSPASFKRFTPECVQDNVQDCSQQSIINAYDNTIVYTDYIVSKVIAMLQAQHGDAAMVYLSDHGESLGENGIYLHGLPYDLAPKEQTHVPLQFWASETFYKDQHIDKKKLLAARNAPYSQDYLFHSILGLYDVQTSAYKKDLDLFAL